MTKKEFNKIHCETIEINFGEKPLKLYESRKGLIVTNTIKLKLFNNEYILAITNYGVKICLNTPEKLINAAVIYDSFNIQKKNKNSFIITIICCINEKIEEPFTLWLDEKGNILNKYRIIDFKYNKFIDKCEDYISDMKVGDIEEIIGDLGSIGAIALLNKISKLLKIKFIKRSKKND